jgi:hypothetical protein
MRETRDFRAHSEMAYNKRVRSQGRIKGVEGWEGEELEGRLRGVEVGGGGCGQVQVRYES